MIPGLRQRVYTVSEVSIQHSQQDWGITCWVHLLANFYPEYPLLIVLTLMASYIYCSRYLFEVWAGGGGEASGERILR